MNKVIKILFFTFFIFLVAFSLVKALDTTETGYRLDPGETLNLNIHDISRSVTNTGSNTYFIPTLTTGEWSSFVTNSPSDITVVEEIDCAGVPFGDSWQSDCGCVSADNDGDDCDDCAGVPNGSATTDNCGTCDTNASNDCTECQLSTLTADGGSNQQVYPNVTVTLDSGVGNGSSCDPNGYIIAYEWTQTSGTFVSLTNYDSSYWHEDWTSPVPYLPTTFTAPFSPGTLTFELSVWDNDFNEAQDEVSIVVFGESEPNYGDCSDFDDDIDACICCNPSDWTGNCNNPEGCCGDGQNVPNSDCWYYYGDCMKRGSYGDGTHLCPQ